MITNDGSSKYSESFNRHAAEGSFHRAFNKQRGLHEKALFYAIVHAREDNLKLYPSDFWTTIWAVLSQSISANNRKQLDNSGGTEREHVKKQETN